MYFHHTIFRKKRVQKVKRVRKRGSSGTDGSPSIYIEMVTQDTQCMLKVGTLKQEIRSRKDISHSQIILEATTIVSSKKNLRNLCHLILKRVRKGEVKKEEKKRKRRPAKTSCNLYQFSRPSLTWTKPFLRGHHCQNLTGS